MDIIDNIYELLEESYEKLSDDLNLNKILNEIESNKGKIKILLGGNYKNIDSQQNRIVLNKNENQIILEEIVSQGLGDVYIFVLLKYIIENGYILSGKAEPFIDKKRLDIHKLQKRQRILRDYYGKFGFKSEVKDRYKLNFDFDKMTYEELVIFYNRLKKFNKTGKWPRI